MKTYLVTVPFAGSICVSVEAENEAAALEAAMNTDFILDCKEGSTNNWPEIVEFNLLKHIMRGDVCYAPLWEYEIEEE